MQSMYTKLGVIRSSHYRDIVQRIWVCQKRVWGNFVNVNADYFINVAVMSDNGLTLLDNMLEKQSSP